MIRKEFLIAAILTFITIVAWVISDIVHTRSKVEPSAKVQELIEPISPNFNIQSIDD